METVILDNNTFGQTLKQHSINTKRIRAQQLQLNITKKCNQSCIHCHVNAGPARTEMMSFSTINRILELLSRNNNIKTVDITGGAPELNPNFRYLVKMLREINVSVIDRCNLTVLQEKGQEGTAEFLAEHKVMIVASLPCYLEDNVDYQRGDDTYRKSILALQQLNRLGYGKTDSGLILNLVYNPLGDYLPCEQQELESDYKVYLKEKHDILFNQLYTITNMPIKRFASQLKAEGKYEDYCNLLYTSFNEKTADKIMCKKMISIGWDGKFYDCDFNQALGIPVASDKATIWDIDSYEQISKTITFGNHCYGCTAGNGSSCQGKLA